MDSNEDQLTRLIRLAQRGKLEAFEAIVRHYEGMLRNWAAAHCPPGVEADDVSQNTFLQAFKRLREFKPETHFEAWLFTIARYQLMTEATRIRRITDYHSRYAPELLFRELERQAQVAPRNRTASLPVEPLPA